jgi:hypothetical protein
MAAPTQGVKSRADSLQSGLLLLNLTRKATTHTHPFPTSSSLYPFGHQSALSSFRGRQGRSMDALPSRVLPTNARHQSVKHSALFTLQMPSGRHLPTCKGTETHITNDVNNDAKIEHRVTGEGTSLSQNCIQKRNPREF